MRHETRQGELQARGYIRSTEEAYIKLIRGTAPQVVSCYSMWRQKDPQACA